MKDIVEYNGNFYTIPQKKYEPYNIYIQRVRYIIKKMDQGTKMDSLIKESYIWANVKFLKCKYSDRIMKKLSS